MSREESRSVAELHAAALAEGGTVTVYAGGDIATQQDGTVAGFRAAFPDIQINMIVDYSKYHNVRIDQQLVRGALVPDVAHLQTLFDFPRWKTLGKLLEYRPAGSSDLYSGFVDPDGFWTTMAVYAFSIMHGPRGGPATPEELIDPRWRGQIVSSHPGDDDATLFLYKTYIERYGWDWFDTLVRQDIRFHRGTNSPGEAVDDGKALVGVAGAATGGAGLVWITPPLGHPFLAWGQRVAIFKDAAHRKLRSCT